MNDDERQARIAQIRARLEAATPGPWDERRQDDYACAAYYSIWGGDAEVIATDWNDEQYPPTRQADCDLIANAPADLAYLLSELAAAQARVERAEAALRNGQKIISGTLEAVVPEPCDCSDEEYCRECLAVSTLEQAFAALAAASEARDGE